MSKMLKLLVALCLTMSAGVAINENVCSIEPIYADNGQPLLQKLCIEGFVYYSYFTDGRSAAMMQAFSYRRNSVGGDNVFTTVPTPCECEVKE